jgi:DNA polymerase III alpha subunit
LAAENIVASRPYGSVKEFAEKTDMTTVDVEAIVALSDAKFFKTKQEKLKAEFTLIRDDIKKRRQRGTDGTNLFEGL